jgi:NADPH:quinone reductase-like Zn-dependent oxidoreductase
MNDTRTDPDATAHAASAIEGARMKAARVHAFGPPSVIRIEQVKRPTPAEGEVLLRVYAAGVGPWDGWIRAGHSALQQTLPLTLGSDLAGTVVEVGPGVTGVARGDQVYGVTNPFFTNAYAEFALATAAMLAQKPRSLSFVEAASVPVVAVTASQMLFKHAGLRADGRVLIHGAAGSVGTYAIQLARLNRLRVIATASERDWDEVLRAGAEKVMDLRQDPMQSLYGQMDAIVDLVGGDSQRLLWPLLKSGATLVSAVSEPDHTLAAKYGVRALFFLVEVTSAELSSMATLIDSGRLSVRIGTTLPLDEAQIAHEMLDGLRERPPGKIVLRIANE